MRSRFSKVMSFFLALAMVLTLTGGFADALEVSAKSKKKTAQESVNVYVTITDNTGKTVMRQQTVEVTDIDGDGSLTMNDALYLAHEKKYKGGAAAGYESKVGKYGISLYKLWGTEGGSTGYYLNSELVMTSLAQKVSEGDFVDAYYYQDLKNFSDKYTFFNKRIVEVHRGEEFTLKLQYTAFDENWNPVSKALKKATIIDGSNETEYKTSKKGKVTLSFDKVGSHFVTAKSPKKKTIIVPPACIVYVLANRGNIFTDKASGIKFKVVESGSIVNNENGTVVVYDNSTGADVPETVVYGGVTFNTVTE